MVRDSTVPVATSCGIGSSSNCGCSASSGAEAEHAVGRAEIDADDVFGGHDYTTYYFPLLGEMG